MAFPDRGDVWHVEHFYSNVVRHVALSCFVVAEDPHLLFSLVSPTQFPLCSYLVNMGILYVYIRYKLCGLVICISHGISCMENLYVYTCVLLNVLYG